MWNMVTENFNPFVNRHKILLLAQHSADIPKTPTIKIYNFL
jgi:hypothetical protein